MQIPEWNTYYPELSSANKPKREFYSKFEYSMSKKKFIEIENNLSYIFLYLYKTVKIFITDKHIKNLINRFEVVNKFYGNIETISTYINGWLKDAYLFKKDYEKAWGSLQHCKYASTEDIIYIRGNCKETNINSHILFKILASNSGLTKFGKEYIDEVSILVDIFLNDFYFEKKMNYAEFFLKKYDFGNMKDSDFEELSDFFPNGGDFKLWKEFYLNTQNSKFPHPKKYHHHLFSGAPMETPYFERTTIPHILAVALNNEFKRIIRESENTVRVEKNLPKVGEGWISETELYYKLSKHYSNEKIIHHGKPHWIKRQHLDIYFPKRNIAIEYQGQQHLEPVEYFGGVESFKKQQRMDKKKKKICDLNGCHLIYVYENYDFKSLTNQIDKVLY